MNNVINIVVFMIVISGAVFLTKKNIADGFKLLLFLVPTQYYIMIGPGKLSFGEVIMLSMIIVIIYRKQWTKNSTMVLLNDKGLKLGLAFVGVSLLSLINSYNRIFTMKESIQIFLYFTLTYSLGVLYLNEKRLKASLKYLYYSGIIVSIVAILQILEENIYGYNIVNFLIENPMKNRATSFFYHPNTLGGYLSILIPFYYFGIIERKNKIISMSLSIIGFVLSIIALIFTYSRGSFLAVCVSIFVISVIKFRKSLKKILIIIGIIIMLGVLWIVFSEINVTGKYNKDRGLSSIGKGSDYSRALLWSSGLNVFKHNKIFGIGAGCWKLSQPDYTLTGEIQDTAHNYYVHILAEMGIFSLVIFVWIIYYFVRNNIVMILKLKGNDHGRRYLLYSFLGLEISFIVSNFFTPIMLRGVAVLFWVMIGANNNFYLLKDNVVEKE